MDVQKQVEYWRSSAEEDLEAARSLLKKRYLRHALFFAHLAMEKTLKAHVSRQTEQVPPKIHNLERLAQIAGLTLDPSRISFLRSFDVYQLEGRYPDAAPAPLDRRTAREDFLSAEEMVAWLKTQL